VKKSILELHIKSKKHLSGKERLLRKEKREADIAVALKKYDSQVHPSGETLSDAVRVYRVVTALLQAGVPLSKANIFRHFLEESQYS
jgi:hypothetical protein